LITQKYAKESQLILSVLIYFTTNGLLFGESFLWIILSIASTHVHVSRQFILQKLVVFHIAPSVFLISNLFKTRQDALCFGSLVCIMWCFIVLP